MPHTLTLSTKELVELEVLVKKEYDFFERMSTLTDKDVAGRMAECAAELASLLQKIRKA